MGPALASLPATVCQCVFKLVEKKEEKEEKEEQSYLKPLTPGTRQAQSSLCPDTLSASQQRRILRQGIH